ncbi:MAG: di-heme enzyme [Candidatus Sulfopaludibacter sp.]|nr:di-heme enzyme [Candidatus Sulfopaludibacter sp.]
MPWCRTPLGPWLAASCFALTVYARSPGPQTLTAVPQGAIHVDVNRLVDSAGHSFLIRGTALPEFRTLLPADGADTPLGFSPYSSTVFGTIRQRRNMNAVRIPLSLADYAGDPDYLRAVADAIRRANGLELTVILSAPTSDPAFWRECSAFLRDCPELIFQLDAGGAAGMQELIHAIRIAGAKQPVLVNWQGERLPDDRNAIYLVSPRYATTRTDQDRDRQLAGLAERVPVLASGLDPELDATSGECLSLPADPSEAEALVEANLDYFDAHGISWVASEFRPGKLIGDYQRLLPTSLENGWTCGQPDHVGFGIGQVVQFHLWGAGMRGLFAVNAAGNFTLARGSIAIVYGAIFAEQDMHNRRNPPPTELGKVSVRITDRTGLPRKAELRYVSSGWGQANFVVPPRCVPGPALVTVQHSDGTTESASVTIADVAPGFWTAPADGRGPVIAVVRGAVPGKPPLDVPLYECKSGKCSSVAVPFAGNNSRVVRLFGTGFRYAADLSDIQVTVAGIRVPVLAFGPAGDAGVDRLTVRLPSRLRGRGEVDLVCSIRGRLSNVVRINLGLAASAPYHWDLPPGFPVPRVPADNPMSLAKVQLGRYLFYDKRISVNQTISCATCHRQELAFTDGKPKPAGATGQALPRNSMSLVNVAYSAALTWSRPHLRSLEQQALVPLLAEEPAELGMSGRVREFLRALRMAGTYQTLFPQAFPREPDPFTLVNVCKAIACFERSIISARSPYDRYHYGGDQNAISDAAKRGEVLFFTDTLAGCYRCHGGFNFSDAADSAGRAPVPVPFHNNGLYNLPGLFSYPPPNLGIYEFTHRPDDVGKFKAPTLRNIALTGPYMHDGSILTLEAVIEHYASGGRKNPNQDKRVRLLPLTPQNRRDLLAFLQSLTDDQLTRDPRFAAPF